MSERQKMIRTPRGMFRLVEGDEVCKLKAQGFGMHHEHGDYVVVCSKNQGVAVSKADYRQYFQRDW